jgi:phosphoribosylformimino-5-aminoimidazole carboxamide ribotide isomerase
LRGGASADLSDPLELLRAYDDALSPHQVYVADLDRIGGCGDNDPILDRLAAAAPEVSFLWDGGIGDLAALERAPRCGRVLPVLATETLRSLEDLPSMLRSAPGGRPVLGLDLGPDGVISRASRVVAAGEIAILERADRAGLRSAILLCLSRVGTGSGLPRERLRRLRDAAPSLELMVGGGISSTADLEFLRRLGCDAALVSTALHEGWIGPSAAAGYAGTTRPRSSTSADAE